MSSYENARATKMLNVRCILCNRPLLNADSVQRAVGPDCARKHGIELALGPVQWDVAAQRLTDILPHDHEVWPLWGEGAEVGKIANALTWWIAHQSERTLRTAAICALHDLGYTALARAAAVGRGGVQVETHGDTLWVRTNYSPTWVEKARTVQGRRWDGKQKVDTFPVASRASLWQALCASFERGTPIVGDRGIRPIP